MQPITKTTKYYNMSLACYKICVYSFFNMLILLGAEHFVFKQAILIIFSFCAAFPPLSIHSIKNSIKSRQQVVEGAKRGKVWCLVYVRAQRWASAELSRARAKRGTVRVAPLARLYIPSRSQLTATVSRVRPAFVGR